jgi:hypothetical protein
VSDKATVAPLPLASGGYIVATESEVVHLGRDGKLRARAASSAMFVGSVLPAAGGALLTASLGGVYRFQPPAPLRRVGDLGGDVRDGGMLASPSTIVAIVDRRRLVAFDLRRGLTERVYVAPPRHALEGPPSLAGDLVVVADTSGEFVALDPRGQVVRRALLERVPLASFGATRGAAARFAVAPSPPLLVGAGGRIAFARTGGRVGILDKEHVAVSADRACVEPLALLPAGEAAVLIACRDGKLMVYAGHAGETTP